MCKHKALWAKCPFKFEKCSLEIFILIYIPEVIILVVKREKNMAKSFALRFFFKFNQ